MVPCSIPTGSVAGRKRQFSGLVRELEDKSCEGAQERWDFLAQLPRTHRDGSDHVRARFATQSAE